MNNHYSDLQVVNEEAHPKYAVLNTDKILANQYSSSEKEAAEVHVGLVSEELQSQPQRDRRRCGLSRRAFWITCACAIAIVVAAAVGGGVGGSLSSKSTSAGSTSANTAGTTTSSNTSPVTSQSSVESGTSTTPTSTTTTISTTTVIGPSGTIFVDCPSSNDTLYTPSSSTQQFRKLCGDAFLNVSFEGSPVVEQVASLDDCINQCASYNTKYASEIAQGTKGICNAACHRSTAVDTSGWCYGYTTLNSSGTFQLNGDNRCNSAALINQ